MTGRAGCRTIAEACETAPDLEVSVMSLHWRISIRREPRYVNIPYWPHRIIVIGWGRLGRHGVFHYNQPCIYRMRLHHCCERAR